MHWKLGDRQPTVLAALPGDCLYWGNGGLSPSPDGTRVAFSTSTQTQHIYVMNVDGTDILKIASGLGPIWTGATSF